MFLPIRKNQPFRAEAAWAQSPSCGWLRAVRRLPDTGRTGNCPTGHLNQINRKQRSAPAQPGSGPSSQQRVRQQAFVTCRKIARSKSAPLLLRPKIINQSNVLDVSKQTPAGFQDRSCPPSQNFSHRFADTEVLRPSKNRGKGRETLPNANLVATCQS